MSEALPRVLLVTDADLTVGSRGAGRTLANLFSRYPAGQLLAISGSTHSPYVMEGGHRVLAGAPGLPGRIVRPLRGVVGDLDALWARWKPLAERAAVAAFAPQLVVASPTHPVGVALGTRYASTAPLVTYLMDDWMAHASSARLAFDTARRGRALLKASSGWLAISPSLLQSMRRDAGGDCPAHVVHNAVALGARAPAALDAPRTGRFRVAYAGSVWPMHWDAIAAVAESVTRLRAGGADIEFVLFTDRFFWARHESDWNRWGVVDGGLIPYAQLGAALGECDLLLVASSFDAAQAHMSRSSVQTKVIDYMAVGRPILACGPSDAASNRFLRAQDCAYFAEDRSPGAVDTVVRACMSGRADGPAVARRAYDVVRRDHEIGAVTERLYEFLRRIATAPSEGN